MVTPKDVHKKWYEKFKDRGYTDKLRDKAALVLRAVTVGGLVAATNLPESMALWLAIASVANYGSVLIKDQIFK